MRVIDSLRLELEPGKSGTKLQLIAPVDVTGHSRHCRPLNSKKRLVDLGAGDHVLRCGKIYRIHGIEPFCWHEVADSSFGNHTAFSDGSVSVGDSLRRRDPINTRCDADRRVVSQHSHRSREAARGSKCRGTPELTVVTPSCPILTKRIEVQCAGVCAEKRVTLWHLLTCHLSVVSRSEQEMVELSKLCARRSPIREH